MTSMAYKRSRPIVITDEKFDKEIDKLLEKEGRSFSNMGKKLFRDAIDEMKKKKQ